MLFKAHFEGQMLSGLTADLSAVPGSVCGAVSAKLSSSAGCVTGRGDAVNLLFHTMQEQARGAVPAWCPWHCPLPV